MKQKILYILIIITAFFGRGEMVFGQSDVDGYKYKIVVNTTSKMGGGYQWEKEKDNCFYKSPSDYITFYLRSDVELVRISNTFDTSDDYIDATLSWKTSQDYYLVNITKLELYAYHNLIWNSPYHSINGVSVKTKFGAGNGNAATSECNLYNDDYVEVKTGNNDTYITYISATYKIYYYELDFSALNKAIEEAVKISVNDLGGFTKTTFTNALEKAKTVQEESVFPTSYWDGSNSQGKQNPTTVNNATSALRGALELAIAYLEAKAEINNLKAQGDSWPKGLSVNVDNALTELDKATDKNGINNAKNNAKNLISIILERNLPEKKFFTLTLPFDYNLNGITDGKDIAYAAQLALVTHNEKDCYTLYFKQVEDGQMRANQPYIVWLPVGLPDFGNVVVNFGEEGSITVNGWTMQGNYTPNTPMNGNFGIAKGLLCKGEGENAKINAYTAYFIPPTHSHGTKNVRARVAVMDEGGNTTYIGEVSDLNGNAAEEVFGIDGMRLPEMRKGINIVRQKDGSVRKIVK